MKILWKYYSSISQLEFFIFYIIFPFSISLSTIRFISFSFFSPPHVVHYLYPSFTLLFFLILPHSSERSRSSFFLQLPLSFFFFTWFQNSLCDKKIFLSSLIQEHFRELSSSSPTQSRWVSWLLSFVFFFSFFFCFYCYDLINFKTVFLSLYSGNLIMLEFRDVWEKDCLLLWFVVFVLCLFMGIFVISSLVTVTIKTCSARFQLWTLRGP